MGGICWGICFRTKKMIRHKGACDDPAFPCCKCFDEIAYSLVRKSSTYIVMTGHGMAWEWVQVFDFQTAAEKQSRALYFERCMNTVTSKTLAFRGSLTGLSTVFSQLYCIGGIPTFVSVVKRHKQDASIRAKRRAFILGAIGKLFRTQGINRWIQSAILDLVIVEEFK